MHTFTRWVSLPENRSALSAVERVADCMGRGRRAVNPLFLHGPSGTGKTHLVSALASEVTHRLPRLAANVLSVGDFEGWARPGEESEPGTGAPAWHTDLLILEDLQHLRPERSEYLVQLLDNRGARHRQMVFTATVGPGQLVHLPARLTSRLACGLVVGLEPLSAASRLAFLQDRAQRRHLAVSQDVLAWLAEHLNGSGRELEGAVTRLETLSRVHDRFPDLATVTAQFRDQVEATRPTVERIANRVSRYFQVEPRDLKSRRRSRNALLPRQVGMYLARRLTPLSLGQIGAYFGGRDHSTVLHACRKVEHALAVNTTLSGTIRLLHADLA